MLAIASIIGRSPGGSVLGSIIGFRNLSVVNDWRYFTGGIENLAIIFCADPFIIGFALADFIDLTITCASSPKKICCIVQRCFMFRGLICLLHGLKNKLNTLNRRQFHYSKARLYSYLVKEMNTIKSSGVTSYLKIIASSKHYIPHTLFERFTCIKH